jgi:hypothetical protein
MNPTLHVHGEQLQAVLPQVRFHEWHSPDGSLWAEFYRVEDRYLLRFPQLADFEVSGEGERVDAWPVPGVQASTVQHLFLNQATPLALSRQGKLVLHASAVEVDGNAVAFIGRSGRGKSTLAASFARSGMRFLTDDGLQLEWMEGRLMCLPSHPSIRLWQDSEQALVPRNSTSAPPVEYTSKTRFLAGSELLFCNQPRQLRHIYSLGAGNASAITIEPVRPSAALLDMVRNSFLLDIGEQEMLARHFDEISRIAELPIHFELDYPRRYETLDSLRDAIVRHVAQGAAG